MGKTLQVVKDRKYQKSKQVLPVEIARGVYLEGMPSLNAMKLFYVLLEAAGDHLVAHETYKTEVSVTRKQITGYTALEIEDYLKQLRKVNLITREEKGKWKTTDIGGLLERATVKKNDDNNIYYIDWSFNSLFIEVFHKSNYWTLLDKRMLYAFKSKYSLILYKHISSYINLEYVKSKTFTVEEFRQICGLGKKLPRFIDLKRRIIEPALKEINEVTNLILNVTYTKKVRTITEMTFSWEVAEQKKLKSKSKDITSLITKTANKLAYTKKPPVDNNKPAFPNNGSIEYNDYWIGLKRQTKCNLDNHLLANQFRDFCMAKKIPLNARDIDKTFVGFCRYIGVV